MKFNICICRCIKRLLVAIGELYGDAELSKAVPKQVEVPRQKDTFSCGWRTILNAEVILQNLFCEDPFLSKVLFYTIVKDISSNCCYRYPIHVFFFFTVWVTAVS